LPAKPPAEAGVLPFAAFRKRRGHFRGPTMLRHRACLGLVALSFILGGLQSAQSADDKGWINLFNGKDLTGWKIRNEKYTVTKYVNEKGDVIPGAKEAKVEQT